jgi:hypothetical protein
MGYTFIRGFVDQAQDPDLELKKLVEIQLRNNHYPPVDFAWIDVAIKAIKAVQSDPEGDFGWDDLEIPVTHRKSSQTHIRVSQVMDGLHLWDLVEREDEDN